MGKSIAKALFAALIILFIGFAVKSVAFGQNVSGYAVNNFVVYPAGCFNDFVGDDSTCIQNAINVAANAGGGTVFLKPVSYFTNTTIINVPNGVTLTCVGHFTRAWVTPSPASFASRPCAIYSSATTAITLVGGSLRDLMIFNTIVHSPGPGATRASMTSYVNSFANTGIAFLSGGNGGTNSDIKGVALAGWATCITSASVAQVVYEDVTCDGTNGINVSASADNSWMRSIELWQFTVAGLTHVNDNWTITALATNGSNLWRVTTSAVNDLATGEKIWINPGTTAQGAAGQWTITVIDTTHFDLQGSAVSHTTTGTTVAATTYITVTSTANIEPGMTVTDSGACLQASSTIGSVWRSRASISLPPNKFASGACASDTLTLTSTAYSGSGGVAFYDGRWRSGTGFAVGQADGLTCSQCFAYDYAVGFDIGGGGAAALGESWTGVQYDQQLGGAGTFIHISNQNVAPVGLQFTHGSQGNNVTGAFLDTSGGTEILSNGGSGNTKINSVSGFFFLTDGVAIEAANGSLAASNMYSSANKQILHDSTNAFLSLTNVVLPNGYVNPTLTPAYTGSGNILGAFGMPETMPSFTIATLPACLMAIRGMTAYVTDGVLSPGYSAVPGTTGTTDQRVMCQSNSGTFRWVYE